MAQKVIGKSVIDSCFDITTGNTLLMYASIENKLDFITRLVNLGAQINATNMEKYTPIHFASMYSREDTLSLLLTKKANPNLIGGPMNQNCLHLASARMSGQSASVRYTTKERLYENNFLLFRLLSFYFLIAKKKLDYK